MSHSRADHCIYGMSIPNKKFLLWSIQQNEWQTQAKKIEQFKPAFSCLIVQFIPAFSCLIVQFTTAFSSLIVQFIPASSCLFVQFIPAFSCLIVKFGSSELPVSEPFLNAKAFFPLKAISSGNPAIFVDYVYTFKEIIKSLETRWQKAFNELYEHGKGSEEEDVKAFTDTCNLFFHLSFTCYNPIVKAQYELNNDEYL